MVITIARGDVEVIKLKSCPKCKTGDITMDKDHHGWYEYCIQCGYMSDLVSVAESEQKQASGSKKRQTASNKGDYRHA
ncbi:MAG TPA: hypothetical protein VMW60_00065 [Dehalococcoidales bacterium]|nr:hypothetical protein [Dehalococcoidales bacterium]